MSNSFGNVLRILRNSKKKSQLDLALDAGISSKHLSFLESGRAMPGRDIVRKLTEALGLSAPYLNLLFVAAGFSSDHQDYEHGESKDASHILRKVIFSHDSNPACAVNGDGRIEIVNRGMNLLISALNKENADVEGLSLYELILGKKGFGPHLLESVGLINRMGNCRLFESLVNYSHGRELEFHSTESPQIKTEDSNQLTIRLKYEGILTFHVLQTVIGHPFELDSRSMRVYYMVPSDRKTEETMELLIEKSKDFSTPATRMSLTSR